VALLALNPDMTPNQSELGHVMVEFPGLDFLETAGAVALLAVASKPSVMDVPVTRSAILEIQATVLGILTHILLLGDLLRLLRKSHLKHMTPDAFYVAVLIG